MRQVKEKERRDLLEQDKQLVQELKNQQKKEEEEKKKKKMDTLEQY